MDELFQLPRTKECYSKYVVNYLDDDTAGPCGKCQNCGGENLLPSTVSAMYYDLAKEFFDKYELRLKPHKRWPNNTAIRFPTQPVLCLTKYGEIGYDEMVKHDIYEEGRVRDALVERGAKILRQIITSNDIRYVTCVPSTRSDVVKDYAMRLAEKCGLEFVDVLGKKMSEEQKYMQNSYFQCENAKKSYFVKDGPIPPKMILVDDIVDSKWTLTVCGDKLGERGCYGVYPLVLADASRKEGQ